MSLQTHAGLRTAANAQRALRQAPTMATQSRRLALNLLTQQHHHQQRRMIGSLPTIAKASFWKLLIPKPLRRNEDGTLPVATAASNARKAKEWNPATFYIFFFLFVGSMAIQMITLKKDFGTFMRQSEVKIGLLKEVVERIQKGETVDVERILGTGDPRQEAEWEAVMREIQRDETSRTSKRQEKAAAEAAAEAAAVSAAAATASSEAAPSTPTTTESSSTGKVASITSFY